MSFLKKKISYHLSFFSICFLVLFLGSFFSVSHTYAAIGDACTGSISSGVSGVPPITGTGTCQTIGSAACDPVTMNVVASTCGTAFCCFPKVAAPAPTNCTYLGGAGGAQCVNKNNPDGTPHCSNIISTATGCATYPGNPTADEVCCRTGGLITPGAPGGSTACTGPGVPAGCTGTPVPGSSASIPFTNPIGGTTVEGVVGSISGVLQGIIVVLALVFIVIGAVIYVTSAGNDERMKTAKGAITASMIGLALAIAAPSFLKQIASVLGWNATEASLTGAKTLTALALSVLQFLLSIIGILGIIMLAIGGLAYLTSAGDEEQAGTGKKIITYAIIGIAVALASLIIVTQVAKLFV